MPEQLRPIRPAVSAALLLACLAATVLLLRLHGQPWWCACGEPSLAAGTVSSSHNSQHLVDPYTLTHILHGVLLAGFVAWLFPRLDAVRAGLGTILAECLWEVFENSDFVIERYRTATIALGYNGDSISNSLGDIVSCGLGFLLARKLGWTKAIAFAIANELLLLFWIRDNLALNILMLIYPLDDVRAWQSP